MEAMRVELWACEVILMKFIRKLFMVTGGKFTVIGKIYIMGHPKQATRGRAKTDH